MEQIDAQLHQIIKKAVSSRPEAVVDVTIDLWKRLAVALTAIVGEGGFQSLYARSVHLASASYPWLASNTAIQQSDFTFAELKNSLAGRDVTAASQASIALLVTFTNILITLIGENLTGGILRSAWGDDQSDVAVKELNND